MCKIHITENKDSQCLGIIRESKTKRTKQSETQVSLQRNKKEDLNTEKYRSFHCLGILRESKTKRTKQRKHKFITEK